MTKNQTDIFHQRKIQLEKILKERELDKDEKVLLKLVLEFGYSTAYCSRTSDMNESFYGAERYDSVYQEIKKKLE